MRDTPLMCRNDPDRYRLPGRGPSGDIIPGPGELLIRLDPLTAPCRTRALTALCDQLTQTRAPYPGTDLILRYQVKAHQNPA